MGITKTIVTRAATDADFRDRILKDPKTTITKELGIEVPQDVTIQLHENTSTVIHIVLPATDGALSEKELAQVAGGFTLATTLAPPTGEITQPFTLSPLPGSIGPIVGAISPLPWMPMR